MKVYKNKIQVFEHQKVTIDSGKHPLPKSKSCLGNFDEGLLKQFEIYHEKNNPPFYCLIRNGVQFTSYVGAIRIGNTTIEVLPKADHPSGKEDSEEKNLWQNVLVDMLKTCHLLKAKQSGEANLRLKTNSIFGLYFELFINEVEQLIRQGLIKKYRKIEGNRNALKGALIFSQQINKNLIHKERFYVRYSNYNKNHKLHQILHEALLVIKELNTSSILSDRIARLLLDFPEVNRLKVNPKIFEKITYSRKNEPYRLALQIAELILLNLRPDISSGSRNLLAIMFDMNKLWEEYVYRILRRYPTQFGKNFNVLPQQKSNFWQSSELTMNLKPDVIIEDGEQCYILDTKWKLVTNGRPDDHDIKQMFAYNHLWKAKQSILLYPGGNDSQSHQGVFVPKLYHKIETDHHCTVGFINILDFKENKEEMAKAIFGKLDLN